MKCARRLVAPVAAALLRLRRGTRQKPALYPRAVAVSFHRRRRSVSPGICTPSLRHQRQPGTQGGKVEDVLADNGYYSADNVQTCVGHGLTPYLAAGRDAHHPGLAERFAADPPPPEDADPVTTMKYRLRTQSGKAVYGLRKSTVEPVFGIIKSVLGYRAFLR